YPLSTTRSSDPLRWEALLHYQCASMWGRRSPRSSLLSSISAAFGHSALQGDPPGGHPHPGGVLSTRPPSGGVGSCPQGRPDVWAVHGTQPPVYRAVGRIT